MQVATAHIYLFLTSHAHYLSWKLYTADVQNDYILYHKNFCNADIEKDSH